MKWGALFLKHTTFSRGNITLKVSPEEFIKVNCESITTSWCYFSYFLKHIIVPALRNYLQGNLTLFMKFIKIWGIYICNICEIDINILRIIINIFYLVSKYVIDHMYVYFSIILYLFNSFIKKKNIEILNCRNIL